MLDEVQATCEAQAEELFHLRRDVRLTRFRVSELLNAELESHLHSQISSADIVLHTEDDDSLTTQR